MGVCRFGKIVLMTRPTVELIPDTEIGGYAARVPDIPAYGEGETEEQAIADLVEALTAYVEAFGLAGAMTRLNPPSSLRQLDIELDDLVRA
jgi:predicted RNase H-like HicB family nuclease